MRKENRNPNRLLPAKCREGHPTSTPEAISMRLNYKPRFIKKSIHVSEALPSSQLPSDASNTYLHSPVSLTQHSTLDIAQAVAHRLKRRENCSKLQEELDSRTQQFNASILYFQRILTGMQRIANDDSIPIRDRLKNTSQRMEELVNVFEEFSIGKEAFD
jgi:hypothetical protein